MELQEKTIAEITVQADYKTFQQYFIYSSKRRLMPWINWVLMFAVAPAYEIFLAVRYLSARQPFPFAMWVLLAINIIGAAYLLLEPRLVYRRRAAEWEAAQRCYAFQEDCVISWDEDIPEDAPEDDAIEGMPEDTLENTPKAEEVLTYDALTLATETRTAFYLHAPDAATNEEACLALPKSCMEEEQIAALRELLAEQLGKKFKGMKAKKEEAE